MRTVAQVIDEFGGVKAFALEFGWSTQRVSNYKARKKFAGAQQMKIYQKCVEKGIKIDLSLVGLES